jgi:hypothetical protein
MIYLSREDFEASLDPQWIEVASRARDALLVADQSFTETEAREKARKKVIKDKEGVWKDKRLTDKMRALSFNKCWYCETEETRSDTAVDHYRPKSAVKECPEHSGYWWLAFDWENYRYSCTYCNEKRIDQETKLTGGKGTSFPLVHPDARLFEPGDLTVEEPMLLDPLIEGDVLLLSFDPDGGATSFYAEEKEPTMYKRVKDSIFYYNLNKEELKERRQKLICKTIKDLVAEGDKYFSRIQLNDRSAREAFNDTLKKLRAMVSPSAEYSAAAKCILSFYRDRPWVESFMRSRMM